MSDLRLTTIRQNYDRVAAEYAQHLSGELDHKPFDRELLERFAKATAGHGEICDMGCGPGHVARFLNKAGAQVSGLDLAPEMLEQARRLNPGILFREGNLLALDLPDGELAGISAFYAIVNLPPVSLPTVFSEMQRVLQPGGLLLLAFHTGDEVVRPSEMWGTPISMEFFYFQRSMVEQYLREAGFRVEEVVERGPYAPEIEHQSYRAYIFARRPGQPAK
jgi:ubiquinone/menaquinone biosynthesis C-methylase UbiE